MCVLSANAEESEDMLTAEEKLVLVLAEKAESKAVVVKAIVPTNDFKDHEDLKQKLQMYFVQIQNMNQDHQMTPKNHQSLWKLQFELSFSYSLLLTEDMNNLISK